MKRQVALSVWDKLNKKKVDYFSKRYFSKRLDKLF